MYSHNMELKHNMMMSMYLIAALFTFLFGRIDAAKCGNLGTKFVCNTGATVSTSVAHPDDCQKYVDVIANHTPVSFLSAKMLCGAYANLKQKATLFSTTSQNVCTSSCRFCSNVGVTTQIGEEEAVCCEYDPISTECQAFTSGGAMRVSEKVNTFSPNSATLFSKCLIDAGQSQPHILLVVLDDAGFNDFGFGMDNDFSTPVMDQLAADGVLLNNHYSLPTCGPSRAALLTGRNPVAQGRDGFNQKPAEEAVPNTGFGDDDQFMSERFKQLGYRTYGYGKWHLGMESVELTPGWKGFDYFEGRFGGSGDHWTHMKVTKQTNCKTQIQFGIDLRRCVGKSIDTIYNATGVHSTDIFTVAAVEAIRSHDVSKNAFIYLSYAAPHTPLQAKTEHLARISNTYSGNRRTLAAMLLGVDEGIGAVKQALEAKSMWEDTITVILSDNGGSDDASSNYPLRGYKGLTLEGGVRTVAIVHTHQGHLAYDHKWMGITPSTFDGLMFIADWTPTLLEAAGVSNFTSFTSDPDTDGVSLWSAFANGLPSPRNEVLFQIQTCDNSASGYCGAIRVSDWKYIQLRSTKNKDQFQSGDVSSSQQSSGEMINVSCFVKPDTPLPDCVSSPCLFNVRDDPCEAFDVSESNPTIFLALQRRLDDLFKKYKGVKSVNGELAPGCSAVASGSWGLWKDVKPCSSLSGINRFNLVSSAIPVFDPDESTVGVDENHCALQCLAAIGCTGFTHVNSTCELYKQNIFVENLVVDRTKSFYGILECIPECPTDVIERFQRLPNKAPKNDKARIGMMLNTSRAECAEYCDSEFGCKSFTFDGSSCRIYGKRYRNRGLEQHGTIDYYRLNSNECVTTCPDNTLDRFISIEATRPKFSSKYFQQFAALDTEHCATTCVDAGTLRCVAFTFEQVNEFGGMCRLYDWKPKKRKALRPHSALSYHILKSKQCINEQWVSSLADDDAIGHVSTDDDDEYFFTFVPPKHEFFPQDEVSLQQEGQAAPGDGEVDSDVPVLGLVAGFLVVAAIGMAYYGNRVDRGTHRTMPASPSVTDESATDIEVSWDHGSIGTVPKVEKKVPIHEKFEHADTLRRSGITRVDGVIRSENAA